MIASDPDASEATDEQLEQAKPFTETFPALADAMRKNMGGRPKTENSKVPVSLRLDADVVEKFKATGPGWQSRMNAALVVALPAGCRAASLRSGLEQPFGPASGPHPPASKPT